MASCELGALTIGPFEVSRWRGVSQVRSYGFSILGYTRVVGFELPTRCTGMWKEGRLGRMRICRGSP